MISMASNVSPDLLAAYLAVAARQAADGDTLSDRSQWAIAHATRQLQTDREVLAGNEVALGTSLLASLRTAPYPSSPSLVSVLLRSAQPAEDVSEDEQRAVSLIERTLADLGNLAGDSPTQDAAERVGRTFSGAVGLAA
jgi:hypothetical protein